jgi:ribosomal-protein-alanine N-acetyltransferase
MTIVLFTERLRLAPFTDAERAPFAELNADPEVRRYFPSVMTRDESDAFVDRIVVDTQAHGFGLYAVHLREGPFVGMCGLGRVTFDPSVLPPSRGPYVELAWRFSRGAWGHGYATEAATACKRHGLDVLGLDELFAFTVLENTRSRRVMERIGMVHEPEHDFDHPRLPEGHPLRRHVLYRCRRKERRRAART